MFQGQRPFGRYLVSAHKNQQCVRVTTRQRSPATCVRFATPGQTTGSAPGGKFAKNEMEASPGEAADHWILALILLTFAQNFQLTLSWKLLFGFLPQRYVYGALRRHLSAVARIVLPRPSSAAGRSTWVDGPLPIRRCRGGTRLALLGARPSTPAAPHLSRNQLSSHKTVYGAAAPVSRAGVDHVLQLGQNRDLGPACAGGASTGELPPPAHMLPAETHHVRSGPSHSSNAGARPTLEPTG
jgi:hypothetical protein